LPEEKECGGRGGGEQEEEEEEEEEEARNGTRSNPPVGDASIVQI